VGICHIIYLAQKNTYPEMSEISIYEVCDSVGHINYLPMEGYPFIQWLFHHINYLAY